MTAPLLGRLAATLLDPELPVPEGLTAWNGSDASVRWGVHRNNVMVSLVAALEEAFPTVAAAVRAAGARDEPARASRAGDCLWASLAASHLRQCPPRSPVLGELGLAFAGWLQALGEQALGERDAEACDLRVWADLARLDHARLRAALAADAPPLDPAELGVWLAEPQRLPELRLQLHDSLAVLRLHPQAMRCWQALEAGEALPARASVQPAAAPVHLLVLRDPMDAVWLRPLSPAAARCIEGWQRGCALAASADDDPAASPAQAWPEAFGALFAHGGLIGLRMGDGMGDDPRPSGDRR